MISSVIITPYPFNILVAPNIFDKSMPVVGIVGKRIINSMVESTVHIGDCSRQRLYPLLRWLYAV